MKKSLLKIGILPLISCFYLSSCGAEVVDETGEEYTITYKESDYYKISDLPSKAKEGDEVDFKVESTSVFYTIESVLANGEKVSESGPGYIFTMPKEDVTITITLSDIEEYDDANDNLSWPASTPTTISTASDSDKNVSWDVTQDLNLGFNNISSSNYITSIKDTIESSNEDVIPNDAITFVPTHASSSNVIIGGKLRIDLKKVNPGTTYLYLNFKPNNSKLGTLIKKVTVVKYGDIKLDTMDVTLKVTNRTDYELDNLFLNLSDQQYVYGSSGSRVSTIYLKDLVDNETTFKYVKGHTYFVSCGALDEDGNLVGGASFTLDDWVGKGSSQTGFNQLKNGVLTLLSSDVVADITIKD